MVGGNPGREVAVSCSGGCSDGFRLDRAGISPATSHPIGCMVVKTGGGRAAMHQMKPNKPVGVNGPVKVSVGTDSSTVEFQHLDFPNTKEEIEAFIVHGFLRDAVANNFLPPVSIAPRQNAQDDFDFTLTIEGHEPKSLELMEIAPLEHLRGSYAVAPAKYKPYELAEYIKTKILKKSERYRTSAGAGIMLLNYVTDWHFVLSESVLRLLQYWLARSSHSFQAIYSYQPIDRAFGVVHVIFPSTSQDNFDPEAFRNVEVSNANPATDYVSRGTGGIEINFMPGK